MCHRHGIFCVQVLLSPSMGTQRTLVSEVCPPLDVELGLKVWGGPGAPTHGPESVCGTCGVPVFKSE